MRAPAAVPPRVAVHLVLAALPLLSITAHVAGLVPMHVSAGLIVIPTALVLLVLGIFVPMPEDRLVLEGLRWGILATAVYDVFRLDTVAFLGWWGDFIPTMGTWLIDVDPSSRVLGGVAGYVWRYAGDGGGLGVVFLVGAAATGLRRLGPTVTVAAAVLFAVGPTWGGLMATVLPAPRPAADVPADPDDGDALVRRPRDLRDRAGAGRPALSRPGVALGRAAGRRPGEAGAVGRAARPGAGSGLRAHPALGPAACPACGPAGPDRGRRARAAEPGGPRTGLGAVPAGRTTTPQEARRPWLRAVGPPSVPLPRGAAGVTVIDATVVDATVVEGIAPVPAASVLTGPGSGPISGPIATGRASGPTRLPWGARPGAERAGRGDPATSAHRPAVEAAHFGLGSARPRT